MCNFDFSVHLFVEIDELQSCAVIKQLPTYRIYLNFVSSFFKLGFPKVGKIDFFHNLHDIVDFLKSPRGEWLLNPIKRRVHRVISPEAS